MHPLKDIKTQLPKALNECIRVREENIRLKNLLGLALEKTTPSPCENRKFLPPINEVTQNHCFYIGGNHENPF